MRSSPIPHLAVVVLLLLSGPAAADESPDLSGSWVLNPALSETLREKARERMPARSDDPRAQLRRERMAQRDRHGLSDASFSRLVVTSSPELVEIAYRDGSVRSIHTDARDLGADPTRGVQSARARWQDATLVIENDTARGVRTESWRLSDDGARLLVTVDLDAGEPLGRLEFTRVYDREPAESTDDG